MASLDYSGTVPTGVRIAQIVGLTSSAWLSGAIATFSIAGIGTILNTRLPSSEAAKAWRELFTIGAGLAPPIAIIPAVSFGYLAYDAHTASALRLGSFRNTAFYLYTFAAIIVPAIAPYTLTVLKSTNAALFKAAKDGGNDQVEALLKTWSMLNFVRSIMVAMGCLAGAWATFGGLP